MRRLEDIVGRSGKPLFIAFIVGAAIFAAMLVSVRHSEIDDYGARGLAHGKATNEVLLSALARNIDDLTRELVDAVDRIGSAYGARPRGERVDLGSLRKGAEMAFVMNFVGPNATIINSSSPEEIGKEFGFKNLILDAMHRRDGAMLIGSNAGCSNCGKHYFLAVAKAVYEKNGQMLGVMVGRVDPTNFGNVAGVIGDAFNGAGVIIYNDGRVLELGVSKVGASLEKSGATLLDLKTADRTENIVTVTPNSQSNFLVSYKFLKIPDAFIAYVRDKDVAMGAWDNVRESSVQTGKLIGLAFLIPSALFALLLFLNARAQARTLRDRDYLNNIRDAAKICGLHWIPGTDTLTVRGNSGSSAVDAEGGENASFKRLLAAFPDEEAGALRSAFEDCARNGVQHRIEITATKGEGKEAPATFAITTRRSARGNVHAICQDVSEWREMRLRLERLVKMDALEHLAAGIAHDFNNLSFVTLDNLEKISAATAKNDPRYVLLDMALGASMKARDLAKQMMSFARRQPLQPSSVDINALLEGLVVRMRRSVAKSVRIGLIESKDGEKPWRTVADRGQLEAVIMHLVRNSNDALRNGGNITIIVENRKLEPNDVIDLDGLEPGDYVVISIDDDGCGMSQGALARAFEPYFTTKKDGAGRGLCQVYGFAKQSGGHVSIYSEEGKGTVVRLYLPRAKAARYPTAQADPSVSGFGFGDETILVVEDEEVVRTHINCVLTGLGYKVIERTDGKSALKLIDEGVKFDLLLTDIVLPGGIDGPTLAAQVRRKLPTMEVVYVSGYANGAPEIGDLTADVSFMQKPFARSDLAGKVRSALEKPSAA